MKLSDSSYAKPHHSRLVLFLACLIIPFLSVFANESDAMKAKAEQGNLDAIMSLTEAYFHGDTVSGISKNFQKAFVWGTVYMKLNPNFGEGIERVTIFSEQELFASEGMSDKEHTALVKEAEQLAAKIKARPTN
jgi:hypothetical protein